MRFLDSAPPHNPQIRYKFQVPKNPVYRCNQLLLSYKYITCENYVSSLKMSNCKTLSELAHRNKSGTTNVADAALT